jgi:hypothetical protein
LRPVFALLEINANKGKKGEQDMRRIAAATAAAVTASAFALTGAAAAGGNGQGNGNVQATGNGNANGHATATATATAQASVQDRSSTHGRSSAHSKAGAHAASQQQTATTSVTVQGVKPSQSTTAQHNTNAPAASTQTKLYGNGNTAGQIAMQNGASATAVLHGPGNSQPHKTTGCAGRHEVDVHALKSHGGGGCATAPTPTGTTSSKDHVTICHATGSSTNPFVVISPSASGVVNGHIGHQDVEDVIPQFQFQGQTFSQNVASGQVTLSSSAACPAAASATAVTPVTPQAAPTAALAQAPPVAQATPATPAAPQAAAAATGVKSATQAVSKPQKSGVKSAAAAATPKTSTTGALGKTLPFTGLPLWIVLIAAGGFIAVGSVLRLTASSTRSI